MKLTKKIFALLALVFALVACDCLLNVTVALVNQQPKHVLLKKLRRVVSFVSPSLRTRNLSVM